MELNELKNLLIADCLEFGLKQNQIDHIFSIVVLGEITSGDNVLSFYYDNKNRYVMEYWERGHAVNGIAGKTADDFRFAFQLFHKNKYDFLIDTSISRREYMKQNDECIMRMLAPKFGHTEAYQKTLANYKKLWTDFNVAMQN